MNDKRAPQDGPGKGPSQGFLVRFVIIVGVFVLLLVVLGYMNTRLESIEEKLQFRPPASAPKAGKAPLPDTIASGQAIYVPVYSHIYAGGGQRHPLEVTLSIRNTDPARTITITSVRYYDTTGALVEDYLKSPLRLEPLETTAFLVKKHDMRGGSGANFITEWVSETVVNEPIVEAVMVGIDKTHQISFVSHGRALHKIGE